MKKNILTILLLVFSISAYSQNSDPIKFLGIPIDGPESEFVSKLKAKGFVYNKTTNFCTGEFYGENVDLLFSTYHGKMRSVAVFFPSCGEDLARLRYNKLLTDLVDNAKYLRTSINGTIPDDENIWYQMSIKKKEYKETFAYFDGTRDALTFYKQSEEYITDMLYGAEYFTTMEQCHEFVQLISELTQESTEFDFVVSQKPFMDFWEKIIEGEKAPGMKKLLEQPEPEVIRQKRLVCAYALANMIKNKALADGCVTLKLDRLGTNYQVFLHYDNLHNIPNGEDL